MEFELILKETKTTYSDVFIYCKTGYCNNDNSKQKGWELGH